MQRKRFNRIAICNSSNYEVSRKVHRDYIKEQHVINADVLTVITTEITVKRQAFINVFGKLIPISEVEVSQHKNLNIIYK